MSASDRDLFALARAEGDAELIEAGQRWDEVKRRWEGLHSDEEADALSAEQGELMVFINNAPPTTLQGCAIKLRVLADPEVGMEVGQRDDDVVSVRAVLAFIEALAQGGDA